MRIMNAPRKKVMRKIRMSKAATREIEGGHLAADLRKLAKILRRENQKKKRSKAWPARQCRD